MEDKIASAIAKNPGPIIGGAFAVVALVGPMRTVRMLSRGMMLAGVLSSVAKRFDEQRPAGDAEPHAGAHEQSVPGRQPVH